MPITLTDAEQAFADSPEGRSAVAYARMTHDMSQRWRGREAAPWTDAMEADAVRAIATANARNAVQFGALMADVDRNAAVQRAENETARAVMIDGLRTAYRTPR